MPNPTIDLRHEHAIDLLKYVDHIDEAERSTLDCYICGALCVVINGEVLDFHRYLHSVNSNWPENGANTGYIER